MVLASLRKKDREIKKITICFVVYLLSDEILEWENQYGRQRDLRECYFASQYAVVIYVVRVVIYLERETTRRRTNERRSSSKSFSCTLQMQQ